MVAQDLRRRILSVRPAWASKDKTTTTTTKWKHIYHQTLWRTVSRLCQIGEPMSFLEWLTRGLGVGGDTCRSRNDSKALLKSSPQHHEKLRKAAPWSSLWDLQVAQCLGEASLCNSVEVLYYFHNVQEGSWSSLSSPHPKLAKSRDVCLLPESPEPHLSLVERGMLQFWGNCYVRGEPSILRSGFLGF